MLLKESKPELWTQIDACEYPLPKRKQNLWKSCQSKIIRFCGEDEEHDPSEEFEEYLACAVCGDNGKPSILFACCTL